MPSLCPQKDRCGSCGWSHIPYEKQLSQKLSDINGSLALKNLRLHCDDIVASPRQEHYRNRMDFAIDFEGRMGLKEKGKWWRVIDGHHCFLAMERIDELFEDVRAWVKSCGLTYWDRKTHEGLLRYAVIRATTTREAMVNLITSAGDPASVLPRLKPGSTADASSLLPTMIWTQNSTITDVSYGDVVTTVSGSGYITEKIADATYRISPQAFFQTNPYAAPLLLNTVKEFCGNLSDKTLLDLYCGTGFFSIAMARDAKRTVGVELSAEAIADARINASLNGVQIEYHDAKTEGFDWDAVGADVVILDPPRSGMHDQALADVLRILPPTIVYVSCNPKNFAREMVQLQRRYNVEAMRAIDMFPHTPHVELVARLVRLH